MKLCVVTLSPSNSSLTDNAIKDKGAAAVASSLRYNHSLKSLK